VQSHLRDRSGIESFLLVVGSDETPGRVHGATARVVRRPIPHISFTLMVNGHLLTISSGWRVVTEVQLGRQPGVSCRSYDQAIIRTGPHTLVK
jgi:hypothetical protein